MARLEIPVTFGTGLLFGGVVLVILSLWVILGNAPWLATATGSGASTVATLFSLGWAFLGFGFLLVVMGIRRISPA